VSPISLIYFAIAALGFGGAFSLTNIAVAHFSPLDVAAARAGIAALATGGYVIWVGVRVPLTRKHLAVYLLLGVLTGAVPFAAIALGQRYITSSLASVVFASIPLFTLLAGPLVLAGQGLKGRKVAGAVTGLVGVAVAVSGGKVFPDQSFLIGGGLTLGAAICYALGGLYVRRFEAIDPRALSVGQLVAAAAMLSVLTVSDGGIPVRIENPSIFMTLVLLGVFGTAAPMVAIYLLIKETSPSTASLVTFFVPFVAVAIGALFLAEPLTPTLVIGFVLVLGGASIVVRTT